MRQGKWTLVVLVGLGLLAGCTQPASTPVPPPTPLPPQSACADHQLEATVCILILGDSIAEGVPLSGDERWWARMSRLVGAELPGRTIRVSSWAVPGSRVDVLAAAANTQSAITTYDIAIVIEGVNDEAWMPLAEWRSRYQAAIETLEAKGLTVLLGTPPPSFENGAFASRYDPTAAAIREVAGNRRPLVDIAARWKRDGPATASSYYSDLIHQGPAGQQLMAELATPIVLEAIGDR
jgi:lysophospholipase L1-like esterase